MGIAYGISPNWINSSNTNSLTGLITTNLVYAFDAGRRLCYSGTGNTVNDLANSGVVGTLTNGPIFDSSQLGFITLDGSNDYIALQKDTNTYNPILLTQSCSVYAWIRIKSQKVNPILDDRTGGPANVGFRLDANSKTQYINYDGQWNYYQSSGATIPLNTWTHIAFTRASSNLGPVKAYVNGLLDNTITVSSPRVLGGGNMTHIGVSWSGGHFNGDISMVLVYSSEHTETQVQQQFNVHRKRYGV